MRMSERQAATAIVRIRTETGDLLALNVEDPRWRLDAEGRYRGVPALLEGAVRPLPLAGLKFIGGLVDEGETPEESLLRELREEAGPVIGAMAAQAGLDPVYRMLRGLEWRPGASIEIRYFGVTVEAPGEDLPRLFEPGDDCLGIVLVRPAQVVRGEDGYAVTGSPVATFWRKAYVPIPYREWHVSPAVEAAMLAYEEAGPQDPFVGLDKASLGSLHVPMFCPRDAEPADVMRPGDEETGRPLPDGAVLARFLDGRRGHDA